MFRHLFVGLRIPCVIAASLIGSNTPRRLCLGRSTTRDGMGCSMSLPREPPKSVCLSDTPLSGVEFIPLVLGDLLQVPLVVPWVAFVALCEWCIWLCVPWESSSYSFYLLGTDPSHNSLVLFFYLLYNFTSELNSQVELPVELACFTPALNLYV